MTNHQDKIAIIVAPNGAKKTKEHHPRLPISVNEIVDEVIACQQAGAAMVHLHARDGNGHHSLDIDTNQRLLDAIKSELADEIVVQLTTEAIGLYTPEQQMELITHTQPEAASFALCELIPDDSYLQTAEKFFHWLTDKSIIPQYILYSEHDLLRYFSLIESGILPNHRHHILLVLGRYHKEMQANPMDLIPFANHPLDTLKNRWAVCAFGRMEQKCLISAMLMGADVRIGFENNHMNCHGLEAASNAEQVSKLLQIMTLLNIEQHSASSFKAELIK